MAEYAEQLTRFTEKCREICSEYEPDEVRIVISGDIVHSKNTISPDLIAFVSMFIRNLQSIAKVIVISGNHDLMTNNLTRIDPITAIFQASLFENATHLDSQLMYDSGIVVDDNITWALYSIFNDFRRPDIEDARKEYPENLVVGLFHGALVGASLNNGTLMESGQDPDIFEGCDFVMAGDIHKRQVIRRGNTEIVYPCSMIQQTFGETVSQHGFAVWDIENKTYEFIDLETNYGLYDFEITRPEDIDEDKEILKN
jgi:DNA repair exonuclease SbcCD nuclease subunit